MVMVYIESSFNFLCSKNTSLKYAGRFMVVQNSNTQNRARMPICYLEEKLNWSWSVENETLCFLPVSVFGHCFHIRIEVEGDESFLRLDAYQKGRG